MPHHRRHYAAMAVNGMVLAVLLLGYVVTH